MEKPTIDTSLHYILAKTDKGIIYCHEAKGYRLKYEGTDCYPVKVTTYIEEDICKWLKIEAEEYEKTPYTTILLACTCNDKPRLQEPNILVTCDAKMWYNQGTSNDIQDNNRKIIKNQVFLDIFGEDIEQEEINDILTKLNTFDIDYNTIYPLLHLLLILLQKYSLRSFKHVTAGTLQERCAQTISDINHLINKKKTVPRTAS